MKACDLVVDGIAYSNSAAKFWRGFLEYLYDNYPGFTCAELSAPAASSLRQTMLFPNFELEEDIRRLAGRDLQAEFRETVAELEMLGPPPPVGVRIMDGAGLLATYALPAERVDAETFQYLAAWILAWSCTPVCLWNTDRVENTIRTLRDPCLARTYSIGVSLRHEEIHEGLLNRVLALFPRILPTTVVERMT